MNIGWRREILRWLYPPRCPVCGDIVRITEGAYPLEAGMTGEADRNKHWHSHKNNCLTGQEKYALVCTACKEGFYRIRPPVCCLCGRPVRQDEELCRNCYGRQFSYLCGFPVWIYNQPMKRSIAAFKYNGRREYAAYYGQEFTKMYGERLKKLSVQALLPVPMYPAKQRARGYNQAELFAEEIGRRLGIRVCNDYLLRVRNTRPQKLLDNKQRYANLQGAFTIDEKKRKCYAGLKNVMLVDDIYTTGSTIETCSRVLLQAGMEKIYAATISIGGN